MRKALAIVAVLGGAVSLLYLWCYIPYRCNSRLLRAIARSKWTVTREADHYVAIPAARATLEMNSDCIRHCAGQIDWLLIAAANLRVLGRDSDAVASYRKALEFDHRPEIYLELGLTELDLGRRDAALRHLALAVRFNQMYVSEIPLAYKSDVERIASGLTRLPALADP